VPPRLGERVRITAQLVDAQAGNQVWTDRYDRPMPTHFALSDEVVRTIVGALVGRVYPRSAEHLRRLFVPESTRKKLSALTRVPRQAKGRG
jgi:hypothetical protein